MEASWTAGARGRGHDQACDGHVLAAGRICARLRASEATFQFVIVHTIEGVQDDFKLGRAGGTHRVPSVAIVADSQRRAIGIAWRTERGTRSGSRSTIQTPHL